MPTDATDRNGVPVEMTGVSDVANVQSATIATARELNARDLFADPETEARFWSKVRKGADCWEWQAARKPFGYGAMSIRSKMYPTHRLSWVLAYGEIPEGLFVCHHCDNPPCVRPDHLFLGTAADNSADMVRKGRQVTPEGRFGTKLDLAAADAIRALAREGESQLFIAGVFGVSRALISQVATERAWKTGALR